MKRTTSKITILIVALLGVMAAGQAMAADCRYIGSGDYTNVLSSSGTGTGWSPDGGGPGGLPGSNDTIRCNYGVPIGNTVTLDGVAPVIRRFQLGVDESGELVVNAGGKLYTTNSSTVGNNSTSNPGVVGALTVNAGGEVYVTNVLFVGNSAANNLTGILTIDGGMVRCTSHLWAGSGASTAGFIYITNGGTLNVGGNIGLGTINASTPSGSAASLFVQEGGVLNLNTMSPVTSIQPGSKLDISGSGVVTKTGDFTAAMSAYTNAGRITAYGGAGTVGIDYNNTNVGKTTLWAIAPAAPPPTNSIWIAASGAGTWDQGDNWDSGVAPLGVTKVNFNVPGTIPCTVINPAAADYVVMGENGPGGTLIITNGGSLVCGAVGANVIGLNSNALMVVENGGSATFGSDLQIGLDPGSDGGLLMNGGTVSVAGLFSLGWQGGTGSAQIHGGTLKLSQWNDYGSLQGNSVLDISGTGVVVINGDRLASVDYYVSIGQITNHAGPGMVAVDYNFINVGKTTIYPADLYLPPAQVTWDPSLSFPDMSGLWNVCGNWAGGGGLCPGNVTFVTFKIADALPCTLTNAALAAVMRMGNGGPGGTLIITNGGSLTATDPVEWNSIGMNNTGLVIVAAGGSASYGNHLWIGYEPAAEGTLILNGGTVSVGGQFGLGWNGGKGTALINGGTLNLAQIHPTDSIKGSSVLDLGGTGTVLITGNHVTPVGNYLAAGKITANGGAGVVVYGFDPNLNKTIVQVAPPKQSITGVSASGGNTTLTYQTTPGHIYHIESSPTLSPATWTRLTGSTTNATGTSVTFTFPMSSDQIFLRTVSP